MNLQDAYRGAAEVLQNAAGAVGNGAAIDMKTVSRLTVQVSGTFVGTVSFQGAIVEAPVDADYFAVGLKTAADGAAVTSATAPGAWKLPTDGPPLTFFRAPVSAWTSGAITAKSFKSR